MTWNGVIIKPLGDNRVKIGNDEYNLTPEIQKALTQTNYNFKNMNDDDILNFTNILKSVNYSLDKDFHSTRRNSIKNYLPKRIEKIVNPSSSFYQLLIQKNLLILKLENHLMIWEELE